MTKNNEIFEARIKRVLFKDWDPIGVNTLPGAQNEYDGYAPSLCEMLRTGASSGEICDYLRWMEVDRMGLDGDEERRQKIAKILIHLTKDDH